MYTASSKPQKRPTVLVIALVAVWCCLLALYALTPALPIGLRLTPQTSGAVGCQIFSAEGTLCPMPLQSATNGAVSFAIPASASHFNFIFTPEREHYQLHALTVFGLPLFNAHWLQEKVRPTLPLYRTDFLPQGAPLTLTITSNARVLDYQRFFAVLLKLFRVYRLGLLLLIGTLLLCIPILLYLQASPHLFLHLKRISSTLSRLSQNRTLFFISAGVIGLLSLPAPINPVEAGLDPSWIWLMNHLALTPSFGTKAVFTYGPPGFVLYSQLPCPSSTYGIFLGLWRTLQIVRDHALRDGLKTWTSDLSDIRYTIKR